MRVSTQRGSTEFPALESESANEVSNSGNAAQAPPMVGCVQKAGDAYALTDENSKTTVQLRGEHLKAGQRVEVTGTAASGTPAAGANRLFDVTGVKPVAGTCPGPTAKGFHISKAVLVSIAVIGGVALYAILKTSSRLGPPVV